MAQSEMTQMVLAQEVKFGREIAELAVTRAAFAKLAEAGREGAAAEVAALTDQLTAMMGRLGNGYEGTLSFDRTGTVFADGIGGKYLGMSLADRDYFAAAKAGQTVIGTPVKSKSSGRPVVVICAPLADAGGKFAGAVGIVMKIDALSDKITAVKIGQTGYPFMIGRDGIIIAHPKAEYILELNLTKLDGMASITSQMMAGRAGVEDYRFKGTDKIAGFAPVPLTGWSIGVTQDRDEFMAAARQIRNVILMVGGAFLALTVLAVLLFARSVTLPIRRIIRGLNDGSDEVAAAASQVAATSQSLAEGASEQAASIEETSSSLEEMSSMTKQNASHSNQADQLMKEANHVVGRANEAMGRLTTSMREGHHQDHRRNRLSDESVGPERGRRGGPGRRSGRRVRRGGRRGQKPGHAGGRGGQEHCRPYRGNGQESQGRGRTHRLQRLFRKWPAVPARSVC